MVSEPASPRCGGPSAGIDPLSSGSTVPYAETGGSPGDAEEASGRPQSAATGLLQSIREGFMKMTSQVEPAVCVQPRWYPYEVLM